MIMMSHVRSLLEDGLAQKHFPSYSFLIARGREFLAEGCGGHSVVVPESVPATTQTIYDLASLTKPLVTSLLALILRRQKIIRFDDEVRRFFPAYDRDGRGDIRLAHLLSHTSGLPDWEPLYLAGNGRQEIYQRLDRIGLEYATGTETIYSCLGYIQLGRILELSAGAPLDSLFRDLVAHPLGLETASYNPAAEMMVRIAATETGNEYERRKCGDRAAHYHGFRVGVIRGEVHDQNCFALGGVAGNAGLFATAKDVCKIAAELLDPQLLLQPDEAKMYFESLSPASADQRSIGLQLGTARDAVGGPALSSKSGAHVGMTGTSIAIDPEHRLILILLTNRLHPVYRDFQMNAFRRRFHEAAIADDDAPDKELIDDVKG